MARDLPPRVGAGSFPSRVEYSSSLDIYQFELVNREIAVPTTITSFCEMTES
jgi:hypothetical protein